MIVEHGEGAVLVALLQPADRLVGNHVGDVARLDLLLAVLDEEGRVVFALRHQNAPEVEALRVGVQMPLADHGRLVAGVVQQLGEGLLRAVEGARVVREAVLVAVFARQDAGARGARDGVGHVAVLEEHAFAGQPVQIGGLDQPVVVAAQGLAGVVVGHHDDDVGLARRLGRSAARQGRNRQRYGGEPHARLGVKSEFRFHNSIVCRFYVQRLPRMWPEGCSSFAIRSFSSRWRRLSPVLTPQSYILRRSRFSSEA